MDYNCGVEFVGGVKDGEQMYVRKPVPELVFPYLSGKERASMIAAGPLSSVLKSRYNLIVYKLRVLMGYPVKSAAGNYLYDFVEVRKI